MSTTVELGRMRDQRDAAVAELDKLRAELNRLELMLRTYDGAVMSNERYGEGFLDGLSHAAAHLRCTLGAES